MTEFKIVSKSFSWNDNLSEEALEDLDMLLQAVGRQSILAYNCSSTIGAALAKLQLLELQGAKVDERICGDCYYLECYKGKDYCHWNKKADKPAKECPKEFTCKHWRAC